jgi:hypothetical protein
MRVEGGTSGQSAGGAGAVAGEDAAAAQPVAAEKAKAQSIRSGFSTSAMLGVGTIWYPVVASMGLGSFVDLEDLRRTMWLKWAWWTRFRRARENVVIKVCTY